MQEILSKLQELIGICEARIKKVDQERTEIGNIRDNMTVLTEELEKRRIELDQREAKIKDSEHVGRTIDYANDLILKAESKQSEVNRQAATLEQDQEALKKEKEEFELWRAERKKKLADDAAALEEKAAEYKKKVLDEITRQTAKG